MATFFGIGVGPGDSELMTVKAVHTIEHLDILYTPKAHKSGTSVAEQIAAPYFPESLMIKRRHFPMTNDWEEKRKSWQVITDEIVADVKAGKNVGFVTLGDPSVYSTYSYLLDLIDDQVAVETIAGISSFSQIAAEVSIPLTLDDELLEIIPATADEQQIAKAIDVNDNIVIMKISTNLPKIYQLLKKRNLLTKALVISNASMEKQKTFRLSEINPEDKLPYFSTVLVKKSADGSV
ncbi:cobalt-factor II C(20)-methyltransferase [Lentilactobacillus diolivorans]|uniref:Precorrin-2 C(20)-methyltransferase n=2 Tax=Lentilactobacillus diolivorans TaxID=179838 RepID=A0A0R1RZW1_9LACO|nr:cobalt-factor II C(20)-methyltransferase [Lentilactobacillus diolivorans]KRL62439.1 precorrin-2 C(20)-methyltransferase [Lentilactobacillus diolivorans DSM 14421]GEP25058.1 precorrin-2 C(20)-methyltransferase [Lentilactobacillus diolivorans]